MFPPLPLASCEILDKSFRTCLQFTAENNAECSELQIPKPGNTDSTALLNLYAAVRTGPLRYHCMEVVAWLMRSVITQPAQVSFHQQ